MAFGQQVGSVKRLKRDMKRSSQGFIKFIPADGNILVRFLTEPDKWVRFTLAYDPVDEVSYPVPDDPTAPGADTSDVRTSERYLANVLDIEADKVVPILLPKTLVAQLTTLHGRSDTIMNRDYDLMRQGSKLDTTYQVIAEAATKRNLRKYQLLDLEQALEADYDQWLSGDKSKKGDSAKMAARGRKRRFAEDDEDEDTWRKHPATGRRRGEVKKRKPHRPPQRSVKKVRREEPTRGISRSRSRRR